MISEIMLIGYEILIIDVSHSIDEYLIEMRFVITIDL